MIQMRLFLEPSVGAVVGAVPLRRCPGAQKGDDTELPQKGVPPAPHEAGKPIRERWGHWEWGSGGRMGREGSHGVG